MASTTFKLNVYPSGQIAQIIRPQVEQRSLLPRVRAVERAAKTLAPKKTGRLARSIHTRARGAGGRFSSVGGAQIAAYEVVAATPYAGFVSKGTRPHVIRSRGPWPLRNRETGQVFGPVVNHPGTRPNDYLQRALRVGFLRG